MLKTAIKNWAEDDRPREKLVNKGAAALSNAELLAILINNGTKEQSAVDVSKNLLNALNNNLNRLGQLSVKELLKLKTKGIGTAKAVTIAAALELGIRRDAEEKKKFIIETAKDAAAYLKAHLQYLQQENFVVLFLNQGNRLVHHEVISQGGFAGTIVDVRIVLKKALEHNAVSIMLCHNHPSGNLQPSTRDIVLTQQIKEAAKYFDITVLDHIIVSTDGYYSFADDDMM
ncbi:MAG: DNA repair protein RadC [Chitinophagaceae bacterium]|jgi:DNA repair protein RadC|nr:DNA repair protein RadC [Chitinophagaceae bacterium]